MGKCGFGVFLFQGRYSLNNGLDLLFQQVVVGHLLIDFCKPSCAQEGFGVVSLFCSGSHHEVFEFVFHQVIHLFLHFVQLIDHFLLCHLLAFLYETYFGPGQPAFGD
jgi:hypothetical protein